METAIRREFAEGPGTHSVDVLAMLYGYPMLMFLAMGLISTGVGVLVAIRRWLAKPSD
jgi:hypothetical protein